MSASTSPRSLREGHRLLADAGATPPPLERSKGGRGGHRPGVRFPVNGVPGAPPPLHGARGRDARERQRERDRSPRRELCVIAVRVWLATPSDDPKRGRLAYIAWHRDGNQAWPAINSITRYGGLVELKAEARAANEHDRAAHRAPVPDTVLARADELRAQLFGRRPATETVPFAEQLRAVIVGPHDEVTPPKPK